jgi:hypothetical protein
MREQKKKKRWTVAWKWDDVRFGIDASVLISWEAMK